VVCLKVTVDIGGSRSQALPSIGDALNDQPRFRDAGARLIDNWKGPNSCDSWASGLLCFRSCFGGLIMAVRCGPLPQAAGHRRM